MDYSTHYMTGEEIHIGDHLLYAGQPAEIVFVIGRDEFEGEFAQQKVWWKREYERGFMIKGGGLGLVLCHEADEDMEFVSRHHDSTNERR